ncbi:MAG TPA: hypothetical protein VEU54_10990 [Steroidobacteraceae bacterium]|nr:hypothetical protein [Steroidobacteraceae bacterium]
MKKSGWWLLAALGALLLAGCENHKAPAERAVASAEASLAEVRDAAHKYVPDQLQAVEAQLAALKASLARGDYVGVQREAPELTLAIAGLKTAAEAKKADTEAALARAKDDWGPLSAEVPKAIEEIAGRIATLSKSAALPRFVTRQQVAAAGAGLESLRSLWSAASSAASSGDFVTAVSKAQAARDKAAQIRKSLRMD